MTVVAESNATDAQLEAFGRALAASLAARGLTSGALLYLSAGKTIEGQRGSVTNWLKGKSEPSRPKVLAMEQFLGLEPGTLSRHLGWLPVEADGLPTPEAAILADAGLLAAQKQILLAALQDFRRLNLDGAGSDE